MAHNLIVQAHYRYQMIASIEFNKHLKTTHVLYIILDPKKQKQIDHKLTIFYFVSDIQIRENISILTDQLCIITIIYYIVRYQQT